MKKLMLMTIFLLVYGCSEELPKLDPACMKMSQDELMNSPEVKDAAVSVKEDQITLILMIAPRTNRKRSLQLGDNFLRMTKALCKDGEKPSKEIGESKYSYIIGLYNSMNQKEIEIGAKSQYARSITW